MENENPLNKLLEKVQRVDRDSLFSTFAHHIEYRLGKYKHNIVSRDVFQSMALTIRDILIDRWNESEEVYRAQKSKRIYYLSMEFLIGRLLDTSIVNMGARKMVDEMLTQVGFEPSAIPMEEPDAGLGNGGLGRLAACFLDSMATLDLPSFGCGLRYEYGIFHQKIQNGFQTEYPDNWLAYGNPWELQRLDRTYAVQFYGHTEYYQAANGHQKARWAAGETVMATAHDMFIPGYRTRTASVLRLWRSRSGEEFNFDYFNHGDYLRAVEDKQRSENISKVLYPNENIIQGKELRLKQEYLLVSATLQDALATFLDEETDLNRLPERVFFQMNDTHPAVAVAEWMRLLVDNMDLPWERAWEITQQCMAYTNHTVMPEAIEQWDMEMFGRLLPRHLQIILEINHRFIEEVKAKGFGDDFAARVSIIGEGARKRVRMGNLAVVGSKAVNGVAALHTELLKKYVFPDFYKLWPEKFQNKTNGITHRRWLVSANPDLSRLISGKIGRDWMKDLSHIRELEKFADDPSFQNDWNRVRKENKLKLARIIKNDCGITVDPDSMFDTQVKRIHEYKRQLLNILRVIGDYFKIKDNPGMTYTPRTVLFGGKAAPGYHRAKLIIKLVHSIGEVINKDKDVADRLKVAFLPNFRVSLAERMYPASDLSEQISTAGTEASGTGNMKFMLNGSVTVGTLDGANVEIREEVGPENFYLFGKTVEDLEKLWGHYDPVRLFAENKVINRILCSLRDNYFSPETPGLFQELYHSLTYGGDQYILLGDYDSYAAVQEQIGADFRDQKAWTRKSILNTARSGKFSTDRTIAEYASQIWDVKPVSQRPPRILEMLGFEEAE
jgi:starch phosphorylase